MYGCQAAERLPALQSRELPAAVPSSTPAHARVRPSMGRSGMSCLSGQFLARQFWQPFVGQLPERSTMRQIDAISLPFCAQTL